MNSRFSLGVGGGYFFIWIPREIAAIISISNATVSSTLMGRSVRREIFPPREAVAERPVLFIERGESSDDIAVDQRT